MAEGLKHWLWVRATALPLIPLFFYFIYQSPQILGDRSAVLAWIAQPLPALALGLFTLCGFVHAVLGVEEIIVDYVSSQKLQKFSLLLNKAFFLLLGIACLYAIVSIHSMGPA